MDKSPDAFRTISEVAEVLDTPAHVLRFWESRFPQIRPVKRAGGRRYYRPADVALLFGIKHLLHDEGLTIRGVQKILREQGVRHVTELSGQEAPEDGDNAEAALEAALAANFGLPQDEPLEQEEAESAQIVALETALRARQAEAVPDLSPADGPAEVLPLFDARADLDQPPPAKPDLAEPASPDLAEPAEAQADIPAETAVPDLPAAPDLPALDLPAPDLPALGLPAPDLPAQDLPEVAPPEAEPEEIRLLLRLRALPAGSLATPKARALRDQAAALAERMASPPPPLAI
jgi:DNA-binding transcriptional MerR regulator